MWNARTEFRLAFRLQLLLGVRIGEVVNASKAEIDLAHEVWVLPAQRTKSRREHRLPLSATATKVLEAVLVKAGGGQWLFPSPVGGEAHAHAVGVHGSPAPWLDLHIT